MPFSSHGKNIIPVSRYRVKGVVSAAEQSAAEYPAVLRVAEIREAEASRGCGEIIRCMRGGMSVQKGFDVS
jgi:hypothetical protein